MSKKLRALAGSMLGLVIVLATPSVAHAEVEPGGWTAYSPSFSVQQRGCGVVSGLTFRLTCSTDRDDQRAERRYATYSGRGSRQFEGFFRITEMRGTRISLKQTFAGGPYFILAVENGGRLYRVGSSTLTGGATVGTRVRVNTVHVISADGRSSRHRTYINGVKRNDIAGPGGSFYDKFGAYRTASGRGPVAVVWSDIRFWRK